MDKLVKDFFKQMKKVTKDSPLKEEDIYCKRCGEYMMSAVNKVISYEGLARVCDKCQTFTEKLGEKIEKTDEVKRFDGILRSNPIKLGGFKVALVKKRKKKKK